MLMADKSQALFAFSRLLNSNSAMPVCIIALLPGVVLLKTSNPIFPITGGIDTWIYFGFFEHLYSFKHDLFPGTYYGSRLSVDFAGISGASHFCALSRELRTSFGRLLHRSGFVVLCLASSLGARTALITAIIFGTDNFIWYEVGSDYSAAAGLTYYLSTLALLMGAAKSGRPFRLLLIAGITWAALIYTNPVWLPLSPAFFAMYLYFARRFRGKPCAALVREFALGFTIGAAVATLDSVV